MSFKLQKSNHIRINYPLLKKDKFKWKKVMCATWDECDTSETKNNSEEKEESFVCFMAF